MWLAVLFSLMFVIITVITKKPHIDDNALVDCTERWRRMRDTFETHRVV